MRGKPTTHFYGYSKDFIEGYNELVTPKIEPTDVNGKSLCKSSDDDGNLPERKLLAAVVLQALIDYYCAVVREEKCAGPSRFFIDNKNLNVIQNIRKFFETGMSRIYIPRIPAKWFVKKLDQIDYDVKVLKKFDTVNTYFKINVYAFATY